MIKLEFSEAQQMFHNNYGSETENSNGYRTIGVFREDVLMEVSSELRSLRDDGFLSYIVAKQTAHEIANRITSN